MLLTREQATELTRQAYDWCLSHDVGTGSARILASTILHCYNGKLYKAELDNIGCLDEQLRDVMLGVIALRYWCEPHLVIKDGAKITEHLAVKFGFTDAA